MVGNKISVCKFAPLEGGHHDADKKTDEKFATIFQRWIISRTPSVTIVFQFRIRKLKILRKNKPDKSVFVRSHV